MHETNIVLVLTPIDSNVYFHRDLLSLPGDPRHASSCNPVRALETQYVFNREVWLDLGNHPTEALAALGARSPCSQIRGRWSRRGGMIGVTSTLFYSISFSSSSIANWVHAVFGDTPIPHRSALLRYAL